MGMLTACSFIRQVHRVGDRLFLAGNIPMTHENNNPPATPLFLVGFMGAGKTTVGRELASSLGYSFIDLDDVIALKAGRSVQQIFAERGESEFRRLETEAIRSYQDQTHSVIALGGGAYVSEENRRLLRQIGKTIWLNCSLEVCLARTRGDRSRPLLGNEEEMRALLVTRRASYAQADFVIDAREMTPEQLVKQIVRLLNL